MGTSSDFRKSLKEYVTTSCQKRDGAAILQLVFLRPRRFIKSLWLNTGRLSCSGRVLSHDFAMLFGDLAIGQQPPSCHNRYVILCWNFSALR